MAWDCRAHCIPRYDVGRGLSLRAAQLGPRDRGPLFERCDGAPLDLSFLTKAFQSHRSLAFAKTELSGTL